MNWIELKTVDVAKDQIHVVSIKAPQYDERANKWSVDVRENGAPVDLTGYSAAASFVRADGSTVTANGTISGSIVSVILPAAAYNVRGAVNGQLCIEKSGERITLSILRMLITAGRTDIIAPEGEHSTIIGNDPLTTTAQTVTGAINELDSGLGGLSESSASVRDSCSKALSDSDIMWEHGGISTVGAESDNQARIRNIGYIHVEKGFTISADAGYSFQLIMFSVPHEKAVIGYCAFNTRQSYSVPQTCYVRFIAGIPNSSEPITDLNLAEHIHVSGNQLVTYDVKRGRKRNLARRVNIPYAKYEYSGDYVAPHYTTGMLAEMYGRWDSLAEQYPHYVTKTVLGTDQSGTYNINQYTITSKADVYQFNNVRMTQQQKMLKMLWIGTIHGNELSATRDDYVFFADLLANHASNPVLSALWDNVTFVVVPIANPWGYDNNKRWNSRNVNLNRNFAADWQYTSHDDDPDNYSGESAGSEAETKAIMRAISENQDAFFMVNRHSSGSFQTSKSFGYVTSRYMSDRNVINNAVREITTKLRDEFSWLGNVQQNFEQSLLCAYISGVRGSLDGYIAKQNHHGAIFEVGPTVIGSSYPTATSDDILRANEIIIGNLIKNIVCGNVEILSDDTLDRFTLT